MRRLLASLRLRLPLVLSLAVLPVAGVAVYAVGMERQQAMTAAQAMGIPRPVAVANADQLLAYGLLGLTGGLLLMLLVAWWSSERAVLRPVRALVRATQQFSAGRLDTRLGPRYAEDELGQLARAFDDMAGTVQAQFAAQARAKRALRAVSECHQAIVRASEEEELFKAVCQIMVDVGDYRLAWIGLAEHDADQTVRLVAWAGEGAGQAVPAKMTWADTPQGQGLTQTAIRTGQTVTCKDIGAAPCAAPWPGGPLQSGQASSVALPLQVGIGGAAWGALSIYATEPEAFAEAEVKLLEELAGNLAYGVEALRLRVERDRAQAALRASEDKFAKAFRLSPDAITLGRLRDGILIDCNEGFSALTGYAPAEARGRAALDGLNIWARAEDRAETAAVLLAGGEITNREITFRRKDGSLRTGLFSARTVEIGGEQCVLTITRDITERKAAEAALRASEEKFARIFHTCPDGITISRVKDSVYLDVNASYSREIGYTREETVGHTAQDLNLWVNLEERARLVAALRAGGEVTNQEYRFRAKNGTIRIALVSGRLLEIDGEPCALIMLRDITERVNAEGVVREQNERLQAQNEALLAQGAALEAAIRETRRLNTELEQRVADRTQELRLANAELVRAARMKDEFLASMSHELRTPLTGILGLSESLELGIYGELTEKQTKTVQAIHGSGQHLLELINDILDVAKVEAGKAELQVTLLKVGEVCESSVQFVQQQAQKKDVRLEVSLDPAVDFIEADPRRLKQMLVNLLGNAVKFTPAGGAVSLAVTGDAARGEAYFTVADTGIGIAPENLPRLFKPFVQLDSRLAREYEGSGLGLALVRGMAELHGGTVRVESELGRGSRFTVTLPWTPDVRRAPGWSASAQRRPAPAAERTPEPAARPAGAERPARVVLVADDSEVVLTTLRDFLAGRGYTVVTAHRGLEAIEKASQSHPAAILMDIQMPGLDGLETIRRLRAIPALAATLVIALTALAMPGDRERCLAAGANAYMTKPMNLEALAASIEAKLAKG